MSRSTQLTTSNSETNNPLEALMAKQGYDKMDMPMKGKSYEMKGKKIMGHEKAPKKCDPFAAQRADLGRIQKLPNMSRGYPSQAMDYKY